MEMLSALRACHWWPMNSSHEGQVVQNFDVFLVVSLKSFWEKADLPVVKEALVFLRRHCDISLDYFSWISLITVVQFGGTQR